MFSYFLQYSNEAARRFLFDITSNKGEKIDDDEYLWSKAKEILPSSYLSIMKANIDFGATIPSSIFNGFDSNPNIKACEILLKERERIKANIKKGIKDKENKFKQFFF